MKLTAAEIEAFREQAADVPGAIAVFETVEDCEGDLEDAAINLALQSGQEPDHSDGWLEDLAKRWRHVLCQADLRSDLEAGAIAPPTQFLIEETTIPPSLAILVVIYVIKSGVQDFCKAFAPPSL